MKSYLKLAIITIFLMVVLQPVYADQRSKLGFLVIAQDRGHLGNKDIKEIFEKFSEEYNASLVFVGRKYDGIGSEYSDHIKRALSKFNPEKISKIVVIPIFLSKSNHILNKIQTNFSAYNKNNFKTKWATSMSESYLIAQILLDRVISISKDSENERLAILGMGAVDEDSENLIKKEYENLIDYVKERKSFKEIQVGIYYDYGVERKIRKAKNKQVDDDVIRSAAKKGKTLLIPFLIGPKYSHMMSMNHWLGQKFEEFDLQYSHESIVTHPNVLVWMKKIANQNTFDENKKIGVVVMPHGSTVPYNQAVEASIQPLRKKYPIEMAYGMGDPFAIQDAVSALETQGVRGIVFVRMYAMSDQFKDKTDYILGLDETLPENYKETFYTDRVPPQVRSSAIIKTFGGYEEDPLIGEIHLERIKEISKNPSKETIILLAHGAKTDQADNAWRKAMQTHLDQIQKKSLVPFKKVVALTMREDWPDKRKKAIEQLKREVELGNKNGRCIIISDRLYGSGPYDRFLKGIKYDINKKGLTPHVNLTMWLENGIQRVLRNSFPSNKPAEIKAENTKLFHLVKKRKEIVIEK